MDFFPFSLSLFVHIQQHEKVKKVMKLLCHHEVSMNSINLKRKRRMRRMENQTVFWDHFRYTFFYTYYIFVSQTPSTSCRINFNLNFLPLFWEQRLVLSVSWNEEKKMFIFEYILHPSISQEKETLISSEWSAKK